MASHLLLFSLGLVLALVAGSGEAVRPHPDCSNTFTNDGITLIKFKEVCVQIADVNTFHATLATQSENSDSSEGPRAVKRLDLLESCSCILLNHELAWASLITHDVNVFYEAIRQFVDEKSGLDESKGEDESKKNDKNKVDANLKKIATGQSKVLFEGEEGKRRFYWDAFDYILKKASSILENNPRSNEADLIYYGIAEKFSDLFYDVAFNLNYVGQTQSQSLRQVISDACTHVSINFGTDFVPLFDRLTMLSGNPHYFYMLTGYNEDLYKLRLVNQACLFLNFTGQLMRYSASGK